MARDLSSVIALYLAEEPLTFSLWCQVRSTSSSSQFLRIPVANGSYCCSAKSGLFKRRHQTFNNSIILLEGYGLLGCNAVWFEENSTFWRNMSLSSSSEKCNPNKKPAINLLLLVFSWLTLWPWRWRRYVSPKCRTFSEIHGFANQKTLLFFVTHVGTSNQTCLFLCRSKVTFVFRKFSYYFGVFRYCFYAFRPFVHVNRAGWCSWHLNGKCSVRISVETLAILAEGFLQSLQVNAGSVFRFSIPQLNCYY
jgi:hypothetical protein